jgi:hypothetical protein
LAEAQEGLELARAARPELGRSQLSYQEDWSTRRGESVSVWRQGGHTARRPGGACLLVSHQSGIGTSYLASHRVHGPALRNRRRGVRSRSGRLRSEVWTRPLTIQSRQPLTSARSSACVTCVIVTGLFLPPSTPPGMKVFCLVCNTSLAASTDATSTYFGESAACPPRRTRPTPSPWEVNDSSLTM